MSEIERVRRKRSPFGEDLCIVWSGVVGFLLQCVRSWITLAERRDDS